MMSLAAIKDLSEQAGKRAKREKKQPYIATKGYNGDARIPNFGDYRPKGWTMVNEHFVDKSGWGGEHEPALTIEKFLSMMKPGYGYAMIEEGQFQCYVGEFEKIQGLRKKVKGQGFVKVSGNDQKV
jgi:hypothetical protein